MLIILKRFAMTEAKSWYSPDVLKKAPEFKFGWRTDEEFARETLAGVNPVLIKRLTVSIYLPSYGLANSIYLPRN